jgi:hypothetical protein
MSDEMFDRGFQDGREQLNAGIDRALTALGRGLWQGFGRLHELQWQAPWRAAQRRNRRTGLA